MTDLATRIEQTTGPDRELDAEIAVAAKQVPYDFERSAHGPASWRNKYDNRWWDAPEYTTSIDAALTLAEGCRVILNIAEDNITTAIVSGTQGIGDTPALAICAADIIAYRPEPKP